MMKYETQKVNFANSDRIQSNDMQFLTFRTGAQNNNTGRSVFSQKIQMYKSLQRNMNMRQDEDELPVRNFKKSSQNTNSNSNLRSIRSQQKYVQGKSYLPIKKQQHKQDNEETNNELAITNYEFKNDMLRKKIQKLIKGIKNEQKKQISLQKDISEIQKQLQDEQQQIQRQLQYIDDLQGINEQNSQYLDKLEVNLQQFQQKNNHLQQLVNNIQESLQNISKTSRQQQNKSKMAIKLKQGIIKLQTLKNQVTNRCIKMDNQIQKIKQYIQLSENLDINIRDTTYTRQTQNNSHFTC